MSEDNNMRPSCSNQYNVTNSVIDIENKDITDWGESDDDSIVSDLSMDLTEQVYQDKLNDIKNQLHQLKNGTHPGYVNQLKELEDAKKNQLIMNKMKSDQMSEIIDSDYNRVVEQINKDFEEAHVHFNETLEAELVKKKKYINYAYVKDDVSLESGPKPRKLRKIPNELVVPLNHVKRGRPLQVSSIQYMLNEDDIKKDVKEASMPSTSATVIVKNPDSLSTKKSGLLKNLSISSGNTSEEKCQDSKTNGTSRTISDPRIEGGKLLYEKRWFYRGQPVFIGEMQKTNIPGVMTAIGREHIWVKKIVDNDKICITLSHLINRKSSIKYRAF